FIDTSGWDYDLTTPYMAPMGGTQSALCYLAGELGKLGHKITIFNGSKVPHGSHKIGFRRLEPYALCHFDAVIAVNTAQGRALRHYVKRAPLILWCHHAHTQPCMRNLRMSEEANAWDHIVFVSQNQRDGYEQAMGLNPKQSRVIYNGYA